MSRKKEFHLFVSQILPATLAASLMSSGASGLLAAGGPALSFFIPTWAIPATEILIGSLIAWWFGTHR